MVGSRPTMGISRTSVMEADMGALKVGMLEVQASMSPSKAALIGSGGILAPLDTDSSQHY